MTFLSYSIYLSDLRKRSSILTMMFYNIYSFVIQLCLIMLFFNAIETSSADTDYLKKNFDSTNKTQSEINKLNLLGRIVNGTKSSLGQFPQQVSLRYSVTGNHFCGGNIIDAEWILTAAHCMYLQTGAPVLPWMILVVAGDLWLNQTSVTSQLRNVTQIIVHENYSDVTYQNDIALLRLGEKIIFENPAVQIGVLQSQALNVGTNCQVSGWGYPAANFPLLMNELMYVDVPIVGQALCKEFYSEIADITDGMICAGYVAGFRDACQGDSGGGLICDGILTGIVSSGNGCAMPGYPGVYTSIRYYRNWISEWSGVNTANKIRFSSWTVLISFTIFCSLRTMWL